MKNDGQEKKNRFKTEVLPYIIIFTAVLLIRIVFLLNCTIPTGSMENTIMPKTRVMGLKCAYWFSEPERGDIVVFYPPDKPHKLYVKRLIGLPGDRIEIEDGVLYLNGEAQEEPYLAEKMLGNFGPYEVPEGYYFFLGDNRNDSLDARFWSTPYVSKDKIVGKVYFTYWPKIHWLAN